MYCGHVSAAAYINYTPVIPRALATGESKKRVLVSVCIEDSCLVKILNVMPLTGVKLAK
jgi:hypothetical protein